jgi:flagellar motor component MotA
MAVSLTKMLTLVLTFVVIAIVLSMGSMIITDVQDTTNSTVNYLYNTSEEALDAFSTFSEFLPALGIIVIIVVIIGALLMLGAYV